MTSNTFAPDFAVGNDPFAGADAACQAAAIAGGLDPNTYVAVIREFGTGALADRLDGARGWVNVLGDVVFDERTELLDDVDYRHIHFLNEFGEGGGEGRIWHGNVGGDCAGWTDTSDASTGGAGFADQVVFVWAGSLSCDERAALVCAGTDHNTAVAPPVQPDPRRIVFLSTTSTPNDGGVAAFDATCQADWDAANGTGTGKVFKALLSGDGVSAASRFSQDEATWVRTDGSLVAETTADMFAANWRTWVVARADGSRVGTSDVTTGAPVNTLPTDPGTAASTCEDWTSVAATATVRVGSARNYSNRWTRRPRNCDTARLVYCAEDVVAPTP